MTLNGKNSGEDTLQVAVAEGTAFVRVQGRGSYKNSVAMKEFAAGAIDRGEAQRVVLDMRDCVSMDSTFMGVLAGMALRLRREGQGEVTLVNLHTRTRGLLSTLGLDHVVKPFLTGHTPENIAQVLRDLEPLAVPAANEQTPDQTVRTMLDAHTMLVKVSPDNLPKFRDVLDYLRKSVQQNS